MDIACFVVSLLSWTTKQQNKQYPCLTVFWNFNRFVLRAPWTVFDDFLCKMTAFASTLRKTKRENVIRKWWFCILRKTDFYGENVGGSDTGSRAKSQPKVDKYWWYTHRMDVSAKYSLWRSRNPNMNGNRSKTKLAGSNTLNPSKNLETNPEGNNVAKQHFMTCGLIFPF